MFCLLAERGNAYVRFSFALLAEFYRSVDESEERVVLAHAYVFTGVVHRAALANDDVARLCELTAEQFDAESLGLRLTAGSGSYNTIVVWHVD